MTHSLKTWMSLKITKVKVATVSSQAFSVPLEEEQLARNLLKATMTLTSKSKRSQTVKTDRRRFKDRDKGSHRHRVDSLVVSLLLRR